ncbi:MAG TPA: hypothetical protein VFQ51_12340 [Vicinamibacteria bacterium]|nr:hypothetical protein [Vicinamibacteria bacterium]
MRVGGVCLAILPVAWLACGAGCRGIGIADRTASPQDAGASSAYRVSASIVPRNGVSPSSVEAFVTIGGVRFPMTRRAGNTWDFDHLASSCETQLTYTIGGRYERTSLFTAAGPALAPEGTLVIRRPRQIVWDSPKRQAGADQLSFLVDPGAAPAEREAASLASLTVKNAQGSPVTVERVRMATVPESATAGGPGDVSFFQLEAVPSLPLRLGCDQALVFDVRFVEGPRSRAAAVVVELAGAPDLTVTLFGKALP